MKILIGIQARSNSTRLPGKIYEKIGDKTVLEHVLDACEKGAVNNNAVESQVVILGPSGDAELTKYCEKNNVLVYLGNTEDNLLERYFSAMNYFNTDAVIRVTSDCPFLPPGMVKMACLALTEMDYVSNCSPRTFADGHDVQGMSARALGWYRMKVKKEEHLFFQLENNCEVYKSFEKKFKAKSILNRSQTILNPYHPANKLSIDTQEDLDRVRKAYEKLGK